MGGRHLTIEDRRKLEKYYLDIEMSKKYNLDFRVYGYEMGMEFNKEIEIVEGEIATYRLIQFKDYKWECPDPKLGG